MKIFNLCVCSAFKLDCDLKIISKLKKKVGKKIIQSELIKTLINLGFREEIKCKT